MSTIASEPRQSTPELLRSVQNAGEDFEWYPTTGSHKSIAASSVKLLAAANAA